MGSDQEPWLQSQTASVQILVLPLTSLWSCSMILGKLPNLCVLDFLIKWKLLLYITQGVVVRIKWINICAAPKIYSKLDINFSHCYFFLLEQLRILETLFMHLFYRVFPPVSHFNLEIIRPFIPYSFIDVTENSSVVMVECYL